MQVTVTEMQVDVICGEPFDVTLCIHNFSKKPVTLKLMEDRSQVEMERREMVREKGYYKMVRLMQD